MFGEVIRRIRTNVLGISILDFSMILNISNSCLHRYENNDLGKKYEINPIVKGTQLAELISKSIFNYTQANNQFKLNELIAVLKIELLELSKQKFVDKRISTYLKEFEIQSIQQLSDFILNIFLIFLDKESLILAKIKDVDLNLNDTTKKMEIITDSFSNRLAWGISIYDNDIANHDMQHVYNCIKRYDILDTLSGDYYTHRWYSITNVSPKPTSFIIHKEYCEVKIFFSNLKISAFEYPNNLKLQVENNQKKEPNLIQIFQINFAKPLFPNESQTIYMRFMVPHEVKSFSCCDMNTSISLVRYKQGVKLLEFGVLNRYEIEQIYSTAIDYSDQILKLKINPIIFDNTHPDFQELLSYTPFTYFNGFRYRIENPTELGYRLHFKNKRSQEHHVDKFY